MRFLKKIPHMIKSWLRMKPRITAKRISKKIPIQSLASLFSFLLCQWLIRLEFFYRKCLRLTSWSYVWKRDESWSADQSNAFILFSSKRSGDVNSQPQCREMWRCSALESRSPSLVFFRRCSLSFLCLQANDWKREKRASCGKSWETEMSSIPFLSCDRSFPS